jgi:hypothetical protein
MSEVLELLSGETEAETEVVKRTTYWHHFPLPEMFLALGFVLVGIALGWIAKLPIALPDGGSLAFTGMSNVVPILVGVVALLVTLVTQRAMRTLYLATTLAAYCAILIVHFNIKLWVQAINPGRGALADRPGDSSRDRCGNRDTSGDRIIHWLD